MRAVGHPPAAGAGCQLGRHPRARAGAAARRWKKWGWGGGDCSRRRRGALPCRRQVVPSSRRELCPPPPGGPPPPAPPPPPTRAAQVALFHTIGHVSACLSFSMMAVSFAHVVRRPCLPLSSCDLAALPCARPWLAPWPGAMSPARSACPLEGRRRRCQLLRSPHPDFLCACSPCVAGQERRAGAERGAGTGACGGGHLWCWGAGRHASPRAARRAGSDRAPAPPPAPPQVILAETYPYYVWLSLVPIIAGCSLAAMKEASGPARALRAALLVPAKQLSRPWAHTRPSRALLLPPPPLPPTAAPGLLCLGRLQQRDGEQRGHGAAQHLLQEVPGGAEGGAAPGGPSSLVLCCLPPG